MGPLDVGGGRKLHPAGAARRLRRCGLRRDPPRRPQRRRAKGGGVVAAATSDPIILAALARSLAAGELVRRARIELLEAMAALERHPEYQRAERAMRRRPGAPSRETRTLAWWVHNTIHGTLFDLAVLEVPEAVAGGRGRSRGRPPRPDRDGRAGPRTLRPPRRPRGEGLRPLRPLPQGGRPRGGEDRSEAFPSCRRPCYSGGGRLRDVPAAPRAPGRVLGARSPPQRRIRARSLSLWTAAARPRPPVTIGRARPTTRSAREPCLWPV
jgi:hypothetical protein